VKFVDIAVRVIGEREGRRIENRQGAPHIALHLVRRRFSGVGVDVTWGGRESFKSTADLLLPQPQILKTKKQRGKSHWRFSALD
jgi:hypothetical protein